MNVQVRDDSDTRLPCITNDSVMLIVIGLKHEVMPSTLLNGIAGRSN